MPRRLTNDLLLALVLAQVLGGVMGWALPVDDARPLYDVHRALGVAILLLLGWKQAIALTSLQRRLKRRRSWDRSILWGSVGGIGLLATLALGLAWSLNLVSFDGLWGYSPLNVHVIVGIGLVPFIAWHMLARRRQNAVSAPLRSRRTLLRVSGLTLAHADRVASARAAGAGGAPADRLQANGVFLGERVSRRDLAIRQRARARPNNLPAPRRRARDLAQCVDRRARANESRRCWTAPAAGGPSRCGLACASPRYCTKKSRLQLTLRSSPSPVTASFCRSPTWTRRFWPPTWGASRCRPATAHPCVWLSQAVAATTGSSGWRASTLPERLFTVL